MLKHLKNNHGLHPVWPALIIAFITVIVIFVGCILLFEDSPLFSQIAAEFRTFFAWLGNLFNPSKHQPLVV